MIPTVLFGLLCLSPVTVMAVYPSNEIPDTVATPAQQCVDFNEGFVGECVITQKKRHRENPHYFLNTNPCHSLKCAKPREDGGYSLFRRKRPKNGTICGLFKACRRGMCFDVEPGDIPRTYGTRNTFECTPPLIPGPETSENKKYKKLNGASG